MTFSDIIILVFQGEKYRGVFEIQRIGDKTSSGEIGLDIRTHASPKVGQDQVSGGVSVLCWHATPVAYVQNVFNLNTPFLKGLFPVVSTARTLY